MSQIHSTHIPQENQQSVVKSTPDSLSLSIEDLDRGLTPAQLDWVLSNLNVRSLIRALAKIAPAEDEGEAHEGRSDGDHGR